MGQQDGTRYHESLLLLMDLLLKAEVAERDVRSITCQRTCARIPPYRDLGNSDFGQLAVDETLVWQLHCGDLMGERHNLAFVVVPAPADAPGYRSRRAGHPASRYCEPELIVTVDIHAVHVVIASASVRATLDELRAQQEDHN